MTEEQGHPPEFDEIDTAPGDEYAVENEIVSGLFSYLLGFGLAVILTVISFVLYGTHLIWGPGIAVALIVLAVAQMGVHIVFFLHITTSPDNTNNVMALAFGVLIVVLVIGGSVWIMENLSTNLAPAAVLQHTPF